MLCSSWPWYLRSLSLSFQFLYVALKYTPYVLPHDTMDGHLYIHVWAGLVGEMWTVRAFCCCGGGSSGFFWHIHTSTVWTGSTLYYFPASFPTFQKISFPVLSHCNLQVLCICIYHTFIFDVFSVLIRSCFTEIYEKIWRISFRSQQSSKLSSPRRKCQDY